MVSGDPEAERRRNGNGNSHSNSNMRGPQAQREAGGGGGDEGGERGLQVQEGNQQAQAQVGEAILGHGSVNELNLWGPEGLGFRVLAISTSRMAVPKDGAPFVSCARN